MTAAIEIEALRKSYDGTPALDVPRLSVEPGQTLALIGPSGCGKSTLLRLIVGLIAPDEGRVTVAGIPLAAATRRHIRLRVGYVIQEGALFPHLTAGDNTTLVARDLGWPEARMKERLLALLELTRIPEEHMSRYPAQLSGGQRQRVALMRALMLDPEVLLLDEPLGALDPISRSGLQRELRDLFERLAKATVFVTHDIAEAAYVGDEMALMQGGRVLQRGTLDELTERPAEPFVHDFIQAQRPLERAGARR